MRMHAQWTVIENGFIHVSQDSHWLDAYLHEITTMPAGRHSDQVDSTSQALAWMSTAGYVDQDRISKLLQDETDRLDREAQERDAGWFSDSGPWTGGRW